jgi:Trypsin-like peptidase domain
MDPAPAGEPPELTVVEIARLGRTASALVLAESGGEGSSFCVRADGWFATNYHVIAPVRGGGRSPRKEGVKLVLNSGRQDQKIVEAKVRWSDQDWDLAILEAEGVKGLRSLSIASETDLAGLRDVVAFGFPLGTAMAVKGQEFPSVNVNRGTVRAVKQVGGDPAVVEADISINPGNSGGPLIDTKGRVVGVIYARVERPGKPGYSLAVPIHRLRRFLSRPRISLDPQIVPRAAWDRPVEFKATLTSLFPSSKPLTVELVLGAAGKGERRFPMNQVDGSYRVVAVPSSGAKSSPVVKVQVERKEVFTDAWVEDLSLTSYRPNIRFSDAERLDLGPVWNAVLRNRHLLMLNRGESSGLVPLFAALENQEPNFDRSTVTRIRVGDISGPDMLPCAVVAREANRPVSRHAMVLLAQDPERPTLQAVTKAQFIQPHRSETPVNSFRMLIPSRNPLGEGAEKLHEGGGAYNFGQGYGIVGGWKHPDGTVGGRFIRIGFFTFRPPGGQDFEAREYVLGVYSRRNESNNPLPTVEVLGTDFATAPNSPEILRKYPGLISIDETSVNSPNFRGKLRQSRLDIEFTGRLRVWEFELDKNPGPGHQGGGDSVIRRLAFDFLLQCKATKPGVKDPPPVAGMLRIRSSFE